MANPTLRTTDVNYNYVNSLLGSQLPGMHEPTVDRAFVRPFGTQLITGLLDKLGSMNGVGSLEYFHQEEDRIHSAVYFEAASAGSANAEVTLTFSTATGTNSIYEYPLTAQSPYISVGLAGADTKAVPVQLYDILIINNVKVMVTQMALSTDQVKVTPIVKDQAVPVIAETDACIIIGSAWGEGTGQGESRTSGVTSYKNNLMIHKRQNTVTGTEMANKTWVTFEGENLWYLESRYEESRRFANECEMLMLLGEKITNETLGDKVPTTTITEGLLPWAEAYGNVQNYNSNAGFQKADAEALVRKLTANRGDRENFFYVGLGLDMSIDSWLDNSFQNGAIQYNSFNGIGGKDRAVEFGFKSFSMNGFSFHKMQYQLFDEKGLLGDIPKYTNYGISIPAGNTTVPDMKGGKTTVPSLRINYLEQGGYSRIHEEFFTGGANGVYTNDQDKVTLNMRTHRGFEGFAPNRYCVIDAA